jgi:hypothetical protein
VNRVLPHPDLINLLIGAYANSVKIPTSNGNTCLHWLVSQPFPRTAIDLQILERVFAAYPLAAFTRNHDKKTPLELLISKAALEDAQFVDDYSDQTNASVPYYGAKYLLGYLLELSQSLSLRSQQ